MLLQPSNSFRETVHLEPGPQSLQHLIHPGTCRAKVDFTLRQAKSIVHRDRRHFWASGATEHIVQSILDLAWVDVENHVQSWSFEVHVHDTDAFAVEGQRNRCVCGDGAFSCPAFE